MIDRVEERFDLKPERLIGDTAYGTAPMLGWMVEEKHIEPHVPVWDKTERTDDTFPAAISIGTNKATNTAARKDTRCGVIGVAFKNPRTHITKATPSTKIKPIDCAVVR